MDCCGHFHAAPDPWRAAAALIPIPAVLAAARGPEGSTEAARAADNTSAALGALRRHISVDVHSHGGRTGITSKAPPNRDLAAAMQAGSLAAAWLAHGPDLPVLGRPARGPPQGAAEPPSRRRDAGRLACGGVPRRCAGPAGARAPGRRARL